MRIVVDVSPLSHQRTGVGNYIRGSLAGLREAGGGHELVAFAPASRAGRHEIERALTGIDVELRLPVLTAAHAVRTLWSRAGAPPVERVVGRLDVFHFSDWMYPPQSGGVRSTMIHDLVPLHHPEWVHRRTRRMHGVKYRNAARTCDVVVVNSRYTRGDVIELLGVPEQRVHVAYPGVDSSFGSDGSRTDLGRPYALTVATLEPRKNLTTLLDAFGRLRERDLALAVAGAKGWGAQADLAADGVIPLGYAATDRLPELYRGAEVFVYPSLFEGFGMPIVEAMTCGVPCVVSSHPSLDEACGTAAVRVDPLDAEAIAAGIHDALRRRDELVGLGRAHAAAFTWSASGRAHIAAWESAR